MNKGKSVTQKPKYTAKVPAGCLHLVSRKKLDNFYGSFNLYLRIFIYIFNIVFLSNRFEIIIPSERNCLSIRNVFL